MEQGELEPPCCILPIAAGLCHGPYFLKKCILKMFITTVDDVIMHLFQVASILANYTLH